MASVDGIAPLTRPHGIEPPRGVRPGGAVVLLYGPGGAYVETDQLAVLA